MNKLNKKQFKKLKKKLKHEKQLEKQLKKHGNIKKIKNNKKKWKMKK